MGIFYIEAPVLVVSKEPVLVDDMTNNYTGDDIFPFTGAWCQEVASTNAVLSAPAGGSMTT